MIKISAPYEPYLLFVYNADAGIGRALIDAVHKIVSPGTYPCSLCAMTYGAVSMRGEWKAALAQLPLPSRFLHRDEFQSQWPGATSALPAVFIVREERPSLLIDGPALDRLPGIPALAAAIDRAIRLTDDHSNPLSE